MVNIYIYTYTLHIYIYMRYIYFLLTLIVASAAAWHVSAEFICDLYLSVYPSKSCPM